MLTGTDGGDCAIGHNAEQLNMIKGESQEQCPVLFLIKKTDWTAI
jgi:hypothetical protein